MWRTENFRGRLTNVWFEHEATMNKKELGRRKKQEEWRAQRKNIGINKRKHKSGSIKKSRKSESGKKQKK